MAIEDNTRKLRIAFLCKRRYMSKDVILDRYARLYEIPYQLARLGHEVQGYCLDYHQPGNGVWTHDAEPGHLTWQSSALGRLKLSALLTYPWQMARELRAFAPDVVIGASDIPHVVLGAWLAHRLGVPYVADLYDNFEGFGQARIPGFVSALRRAVRGADLVTTTSEPLRQLVLQAYGARGQILAMPSSVDKAVFRPKDKVAARERLGLPVGVPLIGTAGGLYRDKGVAPLYAAWPLIAAQHKDVQLVLAGPQESGFPAPHGDRVRYLGSMAHAEVAELFNALDVGIISVLDTPFGRFCFPQKAYEMLACGLPVVVSDVGAMSVLLMGSPELRVRPDDPDALANAILRQLKHPLRLDLPIQSWQELVGTLEPLILTLVDKHACNMRTGDPL